MVDSNQSIKFPDRVRRVAAGLVSLEIWIVAACVTASVVFPRLLPLAVGVAALFWPLRYLAHGRFSRRTPGDWPILLMVLILPVTLWATALPEVTRPQVLRLLSGIGLYYAVANWSHRERHLNWLAAAMLLTGVGLAGYALISVRWKLGRLLLIPDSIYDYLTPLIQDVVHPNVMAGSLTIILPLGLALLLFLWRRMGWLYWAGMAVCSAAMLAILVLTKARAAWLAIGVVILLLVILRWRRGWLLLFLVALVAGAVLLWVGPANLVAVIDADETFQGVEGRVEIWSRGLYMIQDFPFTGVGMGSYGPVADMLYPFFLAEPGKTPHAHNLFLQVAVDLGLPGLIAWLAILGLVVVVCWQVYSQGRRSGNDWMAAFGAGLLASQAALCVQGLLDAVTWGMVRPAPLVWFIWGLAMACGWVFLWDRAKPILEEAPSAAEAEFATQE